MAVIFGRVPKAELGTVYTHVGRFYGIIPVYIGDPFGPAPVVAVRNGLPEWLLDAADLVWNLAVAARRLFDPTFPHPGFMMAVTGEIKKPRS